MKNWIQEMEFAEKVVRGSSWRANTRRNILNELKKDVDPRIIGKTYEFGPHIWFFRDIKRSKELKEAIPKLEVEVTPKIIGISLYIEKPDKEFNSHWAWFHFIQLLESNTVYRGNFNEIFKKGFRIVLEDKDVSSFNLNEIVEHIKGKPVSEWYGLRIRYSISKEETLKDDEQALKTIISKLKELKFLYTFLTDAWEEALISEPIEFKTPKYKINSKGIEYILTPSRNAAGRITIGYFKEVIILYIFKEGKYKPSEFKEYIKSFNILNNVDQQPMPTKNYPEWEHYIDRAKQELLNNKILKKDSDETFSISELKLEEVYNRVLKYLELVLEPFEAENTGEKEYPPDRVPTMVMRTIRDTALAYKIKKKRNYCCQVCGTALIVKGKGYAEAHHIKQIQYDGPDVETNIVILCPNHHVLFDNGEIAIFPEDCKSIIDNTSKIIGKLTSPLPRKEYVEYHYKNIYKKT
ncbi:MAG: HNH endonuclease [bacterium]|nr:HNH endonuclease [bacterium]